MNFYYIYKTLAHPENNKYVAPFSLNERLMHVAEAKQQLQTNFHWICDSMDNDLKHALGDRPNSEFVIDRDGRVVVSRQWSNPSELREDLESLIGKVERPTKISDLNMKPLQPPKTAPTGVVPRIRLPGGMSPVKVEPVAEADGEPFYVKLRAEIDGGFSRDGDGKLYLGFFLDPLYKVHWNNQAAPVSFEIESTKGVVVDRSEATAPKIEEPADADPREFLIEIRRDDDRSSRGPGEILLTVRYFACDDAETFCKPVRQSYRIILERDRDGGSRRSGGGRSSSQRRPSRPPMTREQFNQLSEEQKRRLRQRREQIRQESRRSPR